LPGGGLSSVSRPQLASTNSSNSNERTGFTRYRLAGWDRLG
jgi:hypothetical protein